MRRITKEMLNTSGVQMVFVVWSLVVVFGIIILQMQITWKQVASGCIVQSPAIIQIRLYSVFMALQMAAATGVALLIAAYVWAFGHYDEIVMLADGRWKDEDND